MADRDVIALAAAIVAVSVILVVLLLIPPKAFVDMANAGVRMVQDAVPNAAATTTSSIATTTSAAPTTTAAVAATAPTPTSTSTSSTTTEATPASTVPSTTTTTSTTLGGRRCSSEADCGGGEELTCKGNTIYKTTTRFACENRGSPQSRCVAKPARSQSVIACEKWEKCQKGVCVPVYNNECDMKCHDAEYEYYYCSDEACGMGDVGMSVERSCSGWGRNCCCYTGINPTTTTSSTTTTT